MNACQTLPPTVFKKWPDAIAPSERETGRRRKTPEDAAYNQFTNSVAAEELKHGGSSGAFQSRARNNFARAVTRLQEVLAIAEDDIVRDSLIQRFEFTYELGWKAMFYWLRDQGERVPETGRMVLQAAFKAELIENADLWERIKDFRNETSHTYDAEKAKQVAIFVRAEAADAFRQLRDKLISL